MLINFYYNGKEWKNIMDLYMTLLIDEENRRAMESAYHEDGINDNGRTRLMDKFFDGIQKLLNMIYGWIVKLINNFTALFNRANKSVKTFSSKIIISDIHGYVDYIDQSTELLSNSYFHLKKIRELDQNVVKEMSMLASLKEKMKDAAIRSKSEMTTRQYYEDIHRHFKEVDQCRDAIDAIIANANEDKLVTPIKRYTKDKLEKELRFPLQRVIADLKVLRDDVKNAKETYAERKRLYRFMHKNDIDRTNRLFTETNNAIKQSEQIEALYIKMISYVEEVSSENNQ